MVKLEFQDFEFFEEDEKVKFVFLKNYFFLVDKADLARIGNFKICSHHIEFVASEKTIGNKFNRILSKGFLDLKNVFGKKTVYVHQNSGIPLIGTNEFGIVDRNTSIVEVKPNTICNLNCVYCSVDAGRYSKKETDFVVEEEYLVGEFEKVLSVKEKAVEASINPQGEPLLYIRIVDLVRDLKSFKKVYRVSLNTNGCLLTKGLIDDLIVAGLDQLNISFNSLNQETADKISGFKYPLKKVKDLIVYCKGKIDVVLAPVIIPGFNDSEMEDLLLFGLDNSVKIVGFQNFLSYKRGRNPAKALSMDDFRIKLSSLEDKNGSRLNQTPEDYKIFPDKGLKKPFKKNYFVSLEIKCPGKFKNEFIGVSNDRCVTLAGNLRIGEFVKAKIVRDKHNIFRAVI